MEQYIVDLQKGLLSNRIEDPSQIPVWIMPARLLRIKTYSNVQDKILFTPSLTTPQNHPAVMVIVPLFPISNLSTIVRNRSLLSDLQKGLISNRRIEDPSQIPAGVLPARLLPVKSYSTRNKVPMEFPLFLTANLSTPPITRCFAWEISPNLL